tara:strand:- start:2388 stop:2966 length:579 start_codon:yes stop_codon:yes gene_type:complete
MKEIHLTKEPITLEGFQAILKPSQYGYCLSTTFDPLMINKLEKEREEVLKWAESKLKNKRRGVLKPEPWEEVSKDKYMVKFKWKEEKKPTIVDTEGTPVTDVNIPLYSGSKVKVCFAQKPYILKDNVTYGTTLKLTAVQIVSVKSEAGTDAGDITSDEAVKLFGTSNGYKISDPVVSVEDTAPCSVESDDDF